MIETTSKNIYVEQKNQPRRQSEPWSPIPTPQAVPEKPKVKEEVSEAPRAPENQEKPPGQAKEEEEPKTTPGGPEEEESEEVSMTRKHQVIVGWG